MFWTTVTDLAPPPGLQWSHIGTTWSLWLWDCSNPTRILESPPPHHDWLTVSMSWLAVWDVVPFTIVTVTTAVITEEFYPSFMSAFRNSHITVHIEMWVSLETIFHQSYSFKLKELKTVKREWVKIEIQRSTAQSYHIILKLRVPTAVLQESVNWKIQIN